MRVITNKRLVASARQHPEADGPLQIWRKLLESNDFRGFNELKKTFSVVDIYADKTIFDIRGNRYRIIAGISFTEQICYIKHVLTHTEYDKGKWK